MENIIFLDTETGGTNPDKHSLLSVGLVAWNPVDGIVDTREIFIKNKEYSITLTAQKINKFNLDSHKTMAVDKNEAIKSIRDFCIKNCGKTNEIQIAGHNIQFDVAFLRKLFIDRKYSINSLFSHRIIDTYSILKYLNDAGKIDLRPISSSAAFKYFGINVDGRHSALGDAIATAKLYEALLSMLD